MIFFITKTLGVLRTNLKNEFICSKSLNSAKNKNFGRQFESEY